MGGVAKTEDVSAMLTPEVSDADFDITGETSLALTRRMGPATLLFVGVALADIVATPVAGPEPPYSAPAMNPPMSLAMGVSHSTNSVSVVVVIPVALIDSLL